MKKAKVAKFETMIYQSRTFRKDLHARVCVLAAMRRKRTGKRVTVEAMLNEVVAKGLIKLECDEAIVTANLED